MSEGLYSPKVKPDGSYETLTVVKEGAIDWLTLNRPAALNAMSRTMMLELQHYFGELYTNHSVRVVVVTGAGRGFCAGLDLKEDRADGESGPVAGLRVQRRVSEIVMRMRRAPQPDHCVDQRTGQRRRLCAGAGVGHSHCGAGGADECSVHPHRTHRVRRRRVVFPAAAGRFGIGVRIAADRALHRRRTGAACRAGVAGGCAGRAARCRPRRWRTRSSATHRSASG